MNTRCTNEHTCIFDDTVISLFLDPHAVDQFIDKTPFDILTNDDYESNVNALFGCTLEVRKVIITATPSQLADHPIFG